MRTIGLKNPPKPAPKPKEQKEQKDKKADGAE